MPCRGAVRARIIYCCFKEVLFLDAGSRGWLQGARRLAPRGTVTGLVPQHLLPCQKAAPRAAGARKPNQGSLSPIISRRKCSATTHVSGLAGGQRSKGSQKGGAARTTEVNQTRAQDWFPEFGFTSQYRSHLEPSGDTRSTGSVIPIPQCRLVHPRSHQGYRKYFHILPAL